MRSLLSATANVHSLNITLRIIRMKKVIATLIAGLFASAAFAQTPATVTTTTTTAGATHEAKAHAAPAKHTKAKHVKTKHTKAKAHPVAKTKTVTTVETAK
jgi:hypothetical protein